MPAGLNCAVKVIHFSYAGRDDEVGGANPTGTVLHQYIQGRIDAQLPKTDYSGQGLETARIFDGLFWGHELTMREQDEVEVISPPNHPYFGKRFRIEAHQFDSRHPAIKQGYHLVKLTRSQIAHAERFQ